MSSGRVFHCLPTAAQELTPLSGADPEESAMFFNALNERKILGKIAMGKGLLLLLLFVPETGRLINQINDNRWGIGLSL